MMLTTPFIIATRIPAEWFAPALVWLQGVDTPENLVAAMAGWIALETAALGFLGKAYINQRDRHDAFILSMLEKNLTVHQENKSAIEDNTEIVRLIAEELKAAKRGGNRASR